MSGSRERTSIALRSTEGFDPRKSKHQAGRVIDADVLSFGSLKTEEKTERQYGQFVWGGLRASATHCLSIPLPESTIRWRGDERSESTSGDGPSWVASNVDPSLESKNVISQIVGTERRNHFRPALDNQSFVTHGNRRR